MQYSADQLHDEITRLSALMPTSGADAPVFTAAKRWEVLARLGLGGSVADACRRSGLLQSTVDSYRRKHSDFQRQWDDALAEGLGRMEIEAGRRAVEGTDKPVYYQGIECGAVREYSDTLLMFLMKKRDPSYARSQSQVELSGPGGGPVVTAELSPAQRRILAARLLAKHADDAQAEASSDPEYIDPLS